MIVIKTILIIAFLVLSVVLTIIILMQEGKDSGLSGALTGSADSYWAKNKGRSKDAVIKKVTVFLAVLYFILAILLRSKWI
ncbi:MAG: preprotein translocase subunit SecG [Eubacterium sp.]|nr:preprotein translocase subunit SecG [Eubacterium sp.]HCA20816.1 preprotein translocase subunit SecG [Lachnospiraceae bacterium]